MRPIRRDLVFARFRVVVELDGRLGRNGGAVFRDMHRDNAAAVAGEVAFRDGWVDVVGRPCGHSAELSATPG